MIRDSQFGSRKDNQLYIIPQTPKMLFKQLGLKDMNVQFYDRTCSSSQDGCLDLHTWPAAPQGQSFPTQNAAQDDGPVYPAKNCRSRHHKCQGKSLLIAAHSPASYCKLQAQEGLLPPNLKHGEPLD